MSCRAEGEVPVRDPVACPFFRALPAVDCEPLRPPALIAVWSSKRGSRLGLPYATPRVWRAIPIVTFRMLGVSAALPMCNGLRLHRWPCTCPRAFADGKSSSPSKLCLTSKGTVRSLLQIPALDNGETRDKQPRKQVTRRTQRSGRMRRVAAIRTKRGKKVAQLGLGRQSRQKSPGTQ